MPSCCSTLANQLEVCLGSACMDTGNISGGGSGIKMTAKLGRNSAWAEPNARACSSRAGEGGDGALEEKFRRGMRWDPITVHGTRRDRGLLGTLESKEASETHSKHLPSLSPRVGYLGAPGAPSSVSLGTAVPHLQWHTELELLSVVAEHTPGHTQKQVMQHLLLHADHVLLGQEDRSRHEAAGTSTVPTGGTGVIPCWCGSAWQS